MMHVPPVGSIPDDAGKLELLATIVANAPIPIFLKDAAGAYLFVNDAWVRTAGGTSQDQIIGRTDMDLFPAPDAAQYQADDEAAMQAASPTRSTIPFEIDGEERIFNTVKFPIRSSGGDVLGVCGVSIDITDTLREQDEQEVQRQRDIDAKPFQRLFATLTQQETRIAELLSLGYSDREIAESLSLTPDTVRHHVSHVLKKLRKRSRTQAVIEMLRHQRDA